MSEAKSPTIDGLEIFEIEVDGTRYQRILWIDPMKYYYFDKDATVADFLPVPPGKRKVRYVLLPCPKYDWYTIGVINDIKWRKLFPPDQAVTDAVLDRWGKECDIDPITGVCGVVGKKIGYVRQDQGGRSLRIESPRSYWYQRYRFIAVVSEEPLSQ